MRRRMWRRAFSLARAHRLSLYDALYLELALRSDASLATLDHALSTVAVAEALVLVESAAGPDRGVLGYRCRTDRSVFL